MNDKPLFYYTIQSLRVDSDRSADPIDYRDYGPRRAVGQTLVAFLRAHLNAKIAPAGEKGYQDRPGMPGEGMNWLPKEGVIVAYRPTRETLERWSRVAWLTIDAFPGEITPHEEILRPESLAQRIRERLARR